MRIVVAGSSGLIGSALVAALEEAGHGVDRLLRPGSPPGRGIAWDPEAAFIDASALEGADAVVNLAGRSIGERRWDRDEKALLASSRIASTRLLAGTLAGMSGPPRVLVNASAVGVYGDRADEILTEESPAGTGFFADLCREWEAATHPASAAGIRVVNLRTGIVLSPEGGALGRLLAPFGPRWLSPYRWGLGGWIGRGRQWWSWISVDDQVRAVLHLLDSSLAGPVNLTAPNPVTNREFMAAVGRALRRPVWLPVPPVALRPLLGAELVRATLLDSQRVLPARLLDDGFEFHHPVAGPALEAALRP